MNEATPWQTKPKLVGNDEGSTINPFKPDWPPGGGRASAFRVSEAKGISTVGQEASLESLRYLKIRSVMG